MYRIRTVRDTLLPINDQNRRITGSARLRIKLQSMKIRLSREEHL